MSSSTRPVTTTRLFDTRNSQNDIRKFLCLPPKGWDANVDKKWAQSMEDITNAYLRADFDTQASWRFVSSATKAAVTQQLLDPWRITLPEWDAGKMEQVILWRLQILHKRERDQWWQERRKRRSSKTESVYSASPSSPTSSAPSSAASSTRDSHSPPGSPVRHASVVLPRSSYPYDPVREAASCQP